MGRLVPAAAETTASSSAHLYPQALQLKLYQAFIFSIPILFSIILFLLFYLFYLKRRASSSNHFSSSNSHQPRILPRTSTQPTPYLSFPCQLSLKVELKDKLPIVLFDEELRTRDSLCCVCLGEFEIKEELLQVPLCKHVFHVDCIHHWLLHSNSTCPLCRCSVIPTTISRLHSHRSSDQQPPPPPPQQTLPIQAPEPSPSSSRPDDCLPESVVVHIPEERGSLRD